MSSAESNQDPKLGSTYVSHLNNKSLAMEDERIVEKANANLRSAKLYNLDKLKDSRTCSQKLNACSGYLAKKAKRLKSKSFYSNLLFSKIPIIKMITDYNFKSYLFTDLIGGMTGASIYFLIFNIIFSTIIIFNSASVGIMNIPQGMAYALLATLPPVNGLYISFFPLLIYGIFGTSRHLAIGAIAVVSLLTGGVADRMVNLKNFANTTNTSDINQFRVEVTTSLALLVGLIQFLMGIFGLGILSSFFSDTFISSYTCGSAIHVFVSQIKDLLGIPKAKKYEGILKIPYTIINLASNLTNSNWKTIICSTVCIIYLILFKELINPFIKKKIRLEFPAELLLVILLTVASHFFDFNQKLKISIVGDIPTGLPVPKMPELTFWPDILKDALVIAVIGFSINVSLATLFARKNKYKIEPNQELYAYAGSNVFGSFFSCFPCAASLSRSSVLEASKCKTQLASIFSSVVIIVVILWVASLFEPLPKAVLASNFRI